MSGGLQVVCDIPESVVGEGAGCNLLAKTKVLKKKKPTKKHGEFFFFCVLKFRKVVLRSFLFCVRKVVPG